MEEFFPNLKKNNFLKRHSNRDWVEGSLDVDNSGKYDDNLTNRDWDFLGLSLSARKISLIFLFFLVLFAVLVGRIIYLQLIAGDYYYQLAEGNRIREYPILSQRGVIYDRNGRQLVENVPDFVLSAVPIDLFSGSKKIGDVYSIVSSLIDLSFEDLEAKIQQVGKAYSRPIVLKENLSYEEAILLKIKSEKIAGIAVDVSSQRKYLTDNFPVIGNSGGSSWSHILGYTGHISEGDFAQYKENGYLLSDYLGKTGLEAYYETILRGKYGRKQVEVNALGKEIKTIAQEEEQDGLNLYSSIDFTAQNKLAEILAGVINKGGYKKGSAIAINPNNGEIIALVSYPFFDNNSFVNGISTTEYSALINNPSQPLFNRSVSGEYPSGSVFKPIMAAAALTAGIININTSFNSVGGLSVGGVWFFPDWKAGGHGITNVNKALAWSVNTFFYIIGGGYGDFTGLGLAKITEYAGRFGLGKKLGIDLPGEASGFLPSEAWKFQKKGEEWYIGDTYHLSIGQGDLLVTPLQVAAYTSVFANKGILYQPRLVMKTQNSKDKSIVEISPVVLNKNFVSDAAINAVRSGMRGAVVYGSAQALQSLPVTSAAKTGTAQTVAGRQTHSWFTVFAPYDNSEIAVTVLVEEGGEGGGPALGVARDFLRWYFAVYKKETLDKN